MKEQRMTIQIEPVEYQASIQRLLEILLPDYEFQLVDESFLADPWIELRLMPTSYEQGEPLTTKLTYRDERGTFTDERHHDEILDSRYTFLDYKRRGKDLLKTHLYTFLVETLGETMSPWGILTGVRPTKLFHYLRDSGFLPTEIGNIFAEVYGLSEEKIERLLYIGQLEEKYLPTQAEARKRISLYLGIPFCPSRCGYCSFPAFSLEKHGRFVEPFLQALHEELAQMGAFIQREGYQLDSVYVGGGTPTSLTSKQLATLLEQMATHLTLSDVKEYTVEAGRPDTITREKLEILARAGVRRISINPQTMQQKTLDLIGRKHSVQQVVDVFQWAHEFEFPNINTDVIVGLPGEDFSNLQSTLEQLLALKPDSITVHTLALKKASRWWSSSEHLTFPSDKEVTRMLEYIDRVLKGEGLFPYYMYRQKYILGNQENVGYALPGRESVYNMIMIEERETVIGLGGGSMTKVVDPKDWSLTRFANPKYPGDYISKIQEIVNEKVSLLTSFR